MIIIKVTLEYGRILFINESCGKIEFVDNIKDSFSYEDILEFKVSWKCLIVKYNKSLDILKIHVKKFEAIDINTFDIVSFDVNSYEDYKISIEDILYVDTITFRSLIKCPIGSSHYLYDKDDNWLAFIKDTDYDKVEKISYYKRGLTDIISTEHCWGFRYNKNKWHSLYREFANNDFLLSPIIQKIYLLDYDSCHSFTIYDEKLKSLNI